MMKIVDDATRQQPFYKLTADSLTVLSRLKKRSEILVYLYLRTLAPFRGMVLQIDYDDMKAKTGIRSLGTIYPALSTLHQLGLIDLLHVKTYVQMLGDDENVCAETVDKQNRSARRSYDQRVDRTIGALKNRGSKPANREADSTSKINKTLRYKEKGTEFSFSEEYMKWIREGLEALPRPPRGHYREELIERNANDPEHQRRYLQLQEDRARASFSAAAAAAENFQATQQTEQPEDTLALMARRKRAEWTAFPRKRKAIALWCEENGLECDDGGPVLPCS